MRTRISRTNTNYERLNKSNETLLSATIIVAEFYFCVNKFFFFCSFCRAFKCFTISTALSSSSSSSLLVADSFVWRKRRTERDILLYFMWNSVAVHSIVLWYACNERNKTSTVIKSTIFGFDFKLLRRLWHFYLSSCYNIYVSSQFIIDDVDAIKPHTYVGYVMYSFKGVDTGVQ